MQRRDIFAQIFSFAVASETGLWGDELVTKANISEKFSLSIDKNKFKNAEKSLVGEFNYYHEYLKNKVTAEFYYESMLEDLFLGLKRIFGESFDISSQTLLSSRMKGKIDKSFIDSVKKLELETWYKSAREQ